MSIIYTADLGEARLEVDSAGLFCVEIRLYSDPDFSVYVEFSTKDEAEAWIRRHIDYFE